MFISKSFLNKRFEVDPDIAAFLVDRPVPIGNFYWHKRLLYISRGTGYLFIPLYFDLQKRCGVSKEMLLEESYVQMNEQILHIAALQEAEQISVNEQIAACKKLVGGNLKHSWLFEDLNHYFLSESSSYQYLGTANKALNRADSLLYALCILPVAENVIRKIIDCWYALVPGFLLIDDVMDLSEDAVSQQENAVLEFGEGADGIRKAIQFLQEKIKVLAAYNASLESFFNEMLQKQLDTPYIKSIVGK